MKKNVQNKKAFTLIELLAVIVILAIIALIATPIILNIIEDARKESSERSVELYASAIKNAIAAKQMTGEEITDISQITNMSDYYDGNVSCTTTDIYADGTIYLAECTVNGVLLEDYEYGTYQAPPICTAVTTSLTGNVPTGNYAKGDEYVCEVAEGKSYNFFVLSTNGDNVNLIMDSNINASGNPIKEASPTDKGLVAWNSSGSNSGGPINAMNHLARATASWTNVSQLTGTYPDEGPTIPNYTGSNGYNKIEYGEGKIYGKGATEGTAITLADGSTATLRARMPRYDEVVGEGLCQLSNGGAGNGTCPIWLANYLNSSSYYTTNKTNVANVYGYWTLSSNASDSGLAWSVSYGGSVYSDYGDFVNNANNYGVRPVITISKSQLS